MITHLRVIQGTNTLFLQLYLQKLSAFVKGLAACTEKSVVLRSESDKHDSERPLVVWLIEQTSMMLCQLRRTSLWATADELAVTGDWQGYFRLHSAGSGSCDQSLQNLVPAKLWCLRSTPQDLDPSSMALFEHWMMSVLISGLAEISWVGFRLITLCRWFHLCLLPLGSACSSTFSFQTENIGGCGQIPSGPHGHEVQLQPREDITASRNPKRSHHCGFVLWHEVNLLADPDGVPPEAKVKRAVTSRWYRRGECAEQQGKYAHRERPDNCSTTHQLHPEMTRGRWEGINQGPKAMMLALEAWRL